MLDKLKLVEERYMEASERMAQPEFFSDPKAAARLLKEQRQLEPIVTAYRALCRAKQEQLELREMMTGELDAEMKALCQEEFAAAKKQQETLEQELKILLLPKDPNDEKGVIVEIRGGVAARRAPFLRTACSGCIPCTPTAAAGRSSCSTITRRSLAASRKRIS